MFLINTEKTFLNLVNCDVQRLSLWEYTQVSGSGKHFIKSEDIV